MSIQGQAVTDPPTAPPKTKRDSAEHRQPVVPSVLGRASAFVSRARVLGTCVLKGTRLTVSAIVSSPLLLHHLYSHQAHVSVAVSKPPRAEPPVCFTSEATVIWISSDDSDDSSNLATDHDFGAATGANMHKARDDKASSGGAAVDYGDGDDDRSSHDDDFDAPGA